MRGGIIMPAIRLRRANSHRRLKRSPIRAGMAANISPAPLVISPEPGKAAFCWSDLAIFPMLAKREPNTDCCTFPRPQASQNHPHHPHHPQLAEKSSKLPIVTEPKRLRMVLITPRPSADHPHTIRRPSAYKRRSKINVLLLPMRIVRIVRMGLPIRRPVLEESHPGRSSPTATPSQPRQRIATRPEPVFARVWIKEIVPVPLGPPGDDLRDFKP